MPSPSPRRAAAGALPLLIGLLGLCALFTSSAVAAKDHGRYIVVLKDSVTNPANLAHAQVGQRHGDVKHVYRHALKGYSATLPTEEVAALRKDPRVKHVTLDRKVEIAAQTVPTGIDRIFATANEALDIDGEDDIRIDADIAVLDTGVDHNHPDLDVVERTNCALGGSENEECIDDSGTDLNSHGTHVAGTVAAIDNDEGVVGVAPGARLWAVKVLGDNGQGFASWVIAGVDWVTAHSEEIEVANMSLGCLCSMPALDEAIEVSVDAGIVYVVAAGNEETDASEFSPANHPDVITVSALADFDGQPGGKAEAGSCRSAYESSWGEHADDSLAAFSNYGGIIDIAAPGVCILSTLPGSGFGLKHGTSMASPHVAGAAALLTSESKPKSKEDVEEIREIIVEQGNFEWEDTSGDEVQEPLLDVGQIELSELPRPTVTTAAATSITLDSATLNASVNPNGYDTTYQFQYGPTKKYGSVIPATAKEAGDGVEDVEVGEEITGLKHNRIYHFRIVATNENGKIHGKNQTLTTDSVPVEVIDPATGEPCPDDLVANGTEVEGGCELELTGDGPFGAGRFEDGTPSYLGTCVIGTVTMNLGPTGEFYIEDFPLSEGDFGCGDWPMKAWELPWHGQVEVENGAFSAATEVHFSEPYDSPFAFELTEQEANVWKWSSGGPQIVDVGIWEYFLDFDLVPNGESDLVQFVEEGQEEVELSKPNATTTAATKVTGASASLNATINPNGLKTGYFFQYGTTPEYGNVAPFPSGEIEAGSKDSEVTAPISGLDPQTTYHFRIVASNSEGITYGEDLDFTTKPAPTVSTEPATEVKGLSATLNATVNPNGANTSYVIEYGTSTEYGQWAPAAPKSVGSGVEPVEVKEEIEGLNGDTMYHFRVVAYNSEGLSLGQNRTFTTDATVLEVRDPETGEPCPDDLVANGTEVDGGCEVTLGSVGNNFLMGSIYKGSPSWGMPCAVGDVPINVGPDGEFYIEDFPLQPGTEGCGSSSMKAWDLPWHGQVEMSGGDLTATTDVVFNDPYQGPFTFEMDEQEADVWNWGSGGPQVINWMSEDLGAGISFTLVPNEGSLISFDEVEEE